MSSGLLLDRYRVTRQIGDGRVGVVFLAEDILHDHKEIALKVLNDDQALDQFTELRFDREANISQKLDHPNLITVYDSFFIQDATLCGQQYKNRSAYTMEYIDGSDLRVRLKSGAFTEKEVDKLFIQLLSALEVLHDEGISHRDIKLENILLRKNGDVVLTDLGIMKLDSQVIKTKPGTFMGTVLYFPPEYLLENVYEPRGDLYAVGIVLLEIYAGHIWDVTFGGEKLAQHLITTKFEIKDDVFHKLPVKYRNIARKATAFDREERYQSAAEMRKEFEKDSRAFANTGKDNQRSSLSNLKMVIVVGILLVLFASSYFFLE